MSVTKNKLKTNNHYNEKQIYILVGPCSLINMGIL
jgi:hypothetical protein